MTSNTADDAIRAILVGTTTIALVGASKNPARPAYGVMRYLIAAGYELFPVNPGLAGEVLLGRPVYAALADIPVAIDLVDVFRRTEALAGVVDQALGLDPLPKAIWMQLGLRDDAAAARAITKGVAVVMDRCSKIEHARLIG